jgi:MarR family 2-MHQ and catechol resistance regulon transcriptional repressor
MHLCSALEVMAAIEQEIKQKKFANELVKANVNLMFTANWLSNRISSLLKPHNVTHEQFNVLRILKGSHPTKMCQKDILSRMIAPNSNLTLLIKKLKDKNLITVLQSDRDKREYEIAISAQGLALLLEIEPLLQAKINEFNQLDASEALALNALLDKLRGS